MEVPLSQDEFKEIGHCGGHVKFSVVTDKEGRRSYQIGITHSRPTAAAFFAIYALPQGIPIANMDIGGLSDSANSQHAPPMGGFPVFLASDSQGMCGNECPSCHSYWRTRGGASICPYCGIQAQRYQFLTAAQRRYVEQYCHRLSEALEAEDDGEHVIDMDAVADAVGQLDKPPFYYAEQSQQNMFECDACGHTNDILGTYGYCSACGTRNDLQELEKALRLLRERINQTGPYETYAKEAVSAFDSFANRYARQLLQNVPLTLARSGRIERMHFHNLTSSAKMFSDIFDINLLRAISADDERFASTMFHRRHVYEHKGGEADERYIEESGDTSVRPKQTLREDQGSAHRIATLVLRIATNLHQGFHELLPPLEEPIRWHADRKRRVANPSG